MASVMAKIEALQAVGAEELADQALAKVMQFEIDRLQHEQRRLQAESDTPRRAGGLMSRAASKAAGCYLPTQTA